MGYVLENVKEFERLERQSEFAKYDYRKELAEITVAPGQVILDAGCGSGIVSRYLAAQFPEAQVVGCDLSEERIKMAIEAGSALKNLHFKAENLGRLGFGNNTFHQAVCRYVVEHLRPADRQLALLEVFRVLKPGGWFHIIDFDGIYENIFPQNLLISETLQKVKDNGSVDIEVGRKLPYLMGNAGFVDIRWRIETIECRGQILEDEKLLLPERLNAALPFLAQLVGSEERALEFIQAFMGALNQPNVVLFYNKFVVSGRKPESLRVVTS